ncbi:MAG: MBL fold metallo-hydrolase [Clostridia bacterium]|nr:MBL fold metallo-hydrolase [Clostridia bacterium]
MHLNKKQIFTVILAVLTVFSICACNKNTHEQAEVDVPPVTGLLDIEILDIGKADAIVLTSQDSTVLIDCGEKGDGKDVIEYLSSKNIDSIDCMFITHFDQDHVGGAKKILNSIDVKKIITPDYKGTNDEYNEFIAALDENELTASILEKTMSFVVDDVLYEIYPPKKKRYAEGDNDFSLVIKVTHGENTLLFAGDSEEERLAELDSQVMLDSDFLKVPHHGNYNNNTKKFLHEVSPKYAVITCSEKNPSSQEIIDILTDLKCRTYLTQNGNVNVKSDGQKIEVNQ